MRHQLKWTVAAALFGAGGFFLRTAVAAVPQVEPRASYVGRLSDNGVPANGPRDLKLEIYDVAQGGSFLCQTAGGQVDVIQGVFRIPLPLGCVNALAAAGEKYVDIKVSDVSLGRVKVGAVPYALEASRADVADTVSVLENWHTLTVNMVRGEDLSPVTNQATTGRFRRVGDSLQFQIRTAYSAMPAPASARYDWPLPTGYTVDVSKLVIADSLVGQAVLSDGSIQMGVVTADSLGLHVYVNGAAYYQTSSFGVGSGAITLSGAVPIVVP